MSWSAWPAQAKPSQTVRPWAANQSPAKVGSPPHCVGPRLPRNTLPPHRAATTWNAATLSLRGPVIGRGGA
jgi:hypothetical protein